MALGDAQRALERHWSEHASVVDAGQIVGLIGPNAAGKTTIVNCIAGYLTPSTGSITLNGQRISGLTPEQCAKAGVGRTFQIARTFTSMTALDNVMVGAFLNDRNVARAQAASQELLSFVGLVNLQRNQPLV